MRNPFRSNQPPTETDKILLEIYRGSDKQNPVQDKTSAPVPTDKDRSFTIRRRLSEVGSVTGSAILRTTVAEARSQQVAEARRRELDRSRHDRQRASTEASFRQFMEPHMLPASFAEYVEWLEAWTLQGGKVRAVNHSFENDVSIITGEWQSNWYVAHEDFELVPLYGSSSLNILVPEDITVTGEDRGHSNMYFFKGALSKLHHASPVEEDTSMRHKGHSLPPVHTDFRW